MPVSQILILSNRLPVHRVSQDGRDRWQTSPGGLVSALHPTLQSTDSTWIGWTGSPCDVPEPFTLDGIRNTPVALTAGEIRDYYEGFANRTIWPLYHDAIRAPEFRREWWGVYTEVNQRFARAAAENAGPGAAVWIHDYHLQLVPAMLRALRPDLKIGFFLHIPFPPAELFTQLPWRRQLLEGLLGADVVGFQTRIAAANFRSLCARYLDTSAEGDRINTGARSVLARDFPISIDFDRYDSLSRSDAVAAHMDIVRRRLGDRRMILGVDRLDYTKGIDVRIEAYSDLLAAKHATPADTVFVQVAVPSREKVEEYKDLREEIERMIGAANGRFGEVGRSAIHYLHRSLPPEELIALYRLADVMAVTPARDGMNLVAKEYVAARSDERGVLVLSEFAGAAYELTDAIQVNPHDVDGVAEAFRQALAMPADEQTRRMTTLRSVVRGHDVHHWARTFLTELGA
jgi:alpha,alpha-trehalose-phosphate synthase [UDP-forming]